MKKALITGASSGIGAEIAKQLDRHGYSVILSARRKDRLEALANELKNPADIITADLSIKSECIRLYEETRKQKISVLINNAGFGLIGDFDSTDLDRELSMLELNCAAVHILTKLFLKDMLKRDKGFILNVGSSAGLMPGGPLMSSYYASKAYVVSLTQSIAGELRAKGSHVGISVLCPGPVDTEFNDVAGCSFSVKAISAEYCAKKALNGLFNRKTIIVPGLGVKLSTIVSKMAPNKIVVDTVRTIQNKKIK